MRFVIVACLLEVGQLGEDFDHRDEGRLDDKVDKTDLALRDICRLPIIELAYIEAELFFHVTLGEELDKEQVTPELAEVPRLSRV